MKQSLFLVVIQGCASEGEERAVFLLAQRYGARRFQVYKQASLFDDVSLALGGLVVAFRQARAARAFTAFIRRQGWWEVHRLRRAAVAGILAPRDTIKVMLVNNEGTDGTNNTGAPTGPEGRQSGGHSSGGSPGQ